MRRPWIKIEVATPDKPEICTIASRLKMDEDMVVGKLVRFWAWVAQNRVNGNDLGVTMDFIDRLVNRKGFATALCQAGWLMERDGALSLPNFDRHNSMLARTRALTKQRVERHRIVSGKKVIKRKNIVTSDKVAPVPTVVEQDTSTDDDAEEMMPDEAPNSAAPEVSLEAEMVGSFEGADDPAEAPVDDTAGEEAAAAAVDNAEEHQGEENDDGAHDERNEELSINAIPTFDALDSESVVEKIMEIEVPELAPDIEPEPEAKPVPSRKKEDLFEQPLLF